jgi:nicotinate-nucleotide pyrophosphorylase (carboxylating)
VEKQLFDQQELIRAALREDIGHGDATTLALVPCDAKCRARLHAKQPGVLSGMSVFRAVFDELGADVTEWSAMENGARFSVGDTLVSFRGMTRAVLTGERVALNFVQRLSGIATQTATLVARVKGLSVRICDTRKTTPLLRTLEKEAVTHGGGTNHRFGLFDGILIKENHIVAAGSVGEAVRRAKNTAHHLMKIECEVTSLDEFNEALSAGADIILLDNMSIEAMREAVRRVKGSNVLLEASGNVTLDGVREIAETGVDIISAGFLTHSAPAIDLSLELDNA